MNAFKKTGGFTLVELIIVIAILAILSSVAVVGYSSYITKANNSAVESFLNDISTAATLANAKVGQITQITVVELTAADNKGAKGDLKVTITGNLDEKDFKADFEAAVNEKVAGTLTAGENGAADTYVVYFAAPSAWAGSKYTAPTWSAAAGWSKPAA